MPIWSEVELAARFLPNPILGVTGTNGKTTTAEWLGAMFRAAGREVAVAGNVGRAIAGVDAPPDAWIVCELSSFQLEDVHELRPRVAVLINLEPDHLDRHGSFGAYRDAKLRIFENQTPEETAVVPRGFGDVPGEGRRVEFAAGDPLPAEPGLRGAHNRENAAAATASARAAGLSDDAIAEALRTFVGVAHRLELVRERYDVRFVNDSKATNTAAARRALAAYDGQLHVILGGSRKGEAFDELVREVHGRAYLIGETAGELAEALERAGVPFTQCGDLATAVAAAAGAARPGEVVLLSPACASYDQFRDFEHRGEEFRRLVQNLSG
jgi:UDP-N-acetylmuramoylalanine--D-glutamate ligase